MTKYLEKTLARRKQKNILYCDAATKATVKSLNDKLRKHLRNYGKENIKGYFDYLRDFNKQQREQAND